MRVERYQEDDMRKAMAKVRSELGKDAVLISSRRIDGKTEVTAANGYDPERLNAEIKKLSETEVNGLEGKSHEDFVFELMAEENQAAAGNSPSLVEMQEELGKLRKLFEGELAQLAWRDAGDRQPNRLALLSRLEAVGINRDIGIRIMKKVLPCKDLEIGWHRTLKILSRVIKVSDQDLLSEGGIIALVGPTGVGKTTTAAKIAAQFSALHGKDQVAFVSTDSFRIGGQEQLISLGSTLGVPVQVARSSQELDNTLETFSHRKLVIIDTAGKSQRDTSLMEQFDSMVSEKFNIKPHLVLSATAQESVISETINAFSHLDIASTIITKTDENGSIGAVLSGLIRSRLSVSFVGNGQRIPEDLLQANARIFVAKLINSYKESRDHLNVRRSMLGNGKTQAA